MASPDLGVLRTAKAALDEDLISQEDFDGIKHAFLRAQQIKAGLDAGFIGEQEYARARDAFLHALDFNLVSSTSPRVPAKVRIAAAQAPAQQPYRGSTGGAASTGGGNLRNSSEGGYNSPSKQQSIGARGHSLFAPTNNQHNAAVAAFATDGDTVSAADGRYGGPHSPMRAASASTTAAPFQGGARASMPFPSTVPRHSVDKGSGGGGGGGGAKVSLSGIVVNPDCADIFNHIKTRSGYRFVTYKIDDAGKEVVLDQIGERASSYADFVASLPHSNCRYAVYDYERGSLKKLVFVNWVPDNSYAKEKMMYSTTKEALKGSLDGIAAEMQATDVSDLDLDEMTEKIKAGMTRPQG